MKTNCYEHQTLSKHIFLSPDTSDLYLKPEYTF